jgi:hypothetical protein
MEKALENDILGTIGSQNICAQLPGETATKWMSQKA